MQNLLKGKRVLVAGASGFVGTNLVKKLLDLDCEILTPVNNSSITAELKAYYKQKSNKTIHSQFNYHCDFLSYEDCQRLLKCYNDVYCIFMCAANTCGAEGIMKSPLDLINPNIIMNVNLLKAAYEADVKKFIFVSSNAAYYEKDSPVSELEAFDGDPLDCYFGIGWVKRYIEKLMQFYAEKLSRTMTCIALRSANLYGPYDHFEESRSHVIPALIKKVVDRQNPIEVWGNGQNVKDFLYVDDFVDCMILAAEKLDGFHLLNVGSGIETQVSLLLKIIISQDKYENCTVVNNIDKPSMVDYRILNIKKVKKVLGFKPKINLKEGLKKTIDWYILDKVCQITSGGRIPMGSSGYVHMS